MFIMVLLEYLKHFLDENSIIKNYQNYENILHYKVMHITLQYV